MPGGPSRKRQAKAIHVTGLSESLEQFKALPAKVRRAMVSAINEQAQATQQSMVERIAADGIQKSAVRARIHLTKANNNKDEATLSLDTKRVPFNRVKYTVRMEDSSGTRASIWVSRGGKRVQVYGFANPYGKKKRPLIRYSKGKESRLVLAGGVGLRGYWNDIVNEQYLADLRLELQQRFSKRIQDQ